MGSGKMFNIGRFHLGRVLKHDLLANNLIALPEIIRRTPPDDDEMVFGMVSRPSRLFAL